MSQTTVATISRNERYVLSAKTKHLAPLWLQMSKMVPTSPSTEGVPFLWKYEDAKPLLLEAGENISAEDAERRVLMLVNPALEAPYTIDTIYGGLQLILPGETAPAHRHVAFALRFIIEGNGGFTAVEGQKIFMKRGDVILTPSWAWHDHGNEGSEPVIWLDGLDLPLFRHAPVNFTEQHLELRYPSVVNNETPWRFPWEDVEAKLNQGIGPHRVYHYQQDGQHLSRTISARAEYIQSGGRSTESQDTCSYIYHCVEGCGRTIIKSQDGHRQTINWVARDTFAVPAWSRVQHINGYSSASFLFAIHDRPMLENLGLFREAQIAQVEQMPSML